MKIKVLKVIILMLISTLVLSVAVLPCFAYGAERDSFNAIIDESVLVTPLDWDVTFEIDGVSYSDDYVSSYVNFKFDPVFPFAGRSAVLDSNTSESTSSNFYLENQGSDDAVSFNLNTTYVFDNNYLGLVDIQYDWGLSSSWSTWDVVGVQFQARQFYYTYQSDVEPYLDVPSPFQFYFEGATSVTTQVYYHELGNDVDLLTLSFTASNESALAPYLFGYSEDESFTLFIDRVVVIPDYNSLSGSLDMDYAYDGVYCEFSRAADLNTHVTPPSDAVFADYTSWIGLAVSGFLEFQVFPGFSFGALLMVIISFSTVMWFLKLFAGG